MKFISKNFQLISVCFIFMLFLLFMNLILYVEVDELVIPQIPYIIFMVALLLVNFIVFIFFQMKYAFNRKVLSNFLISLPFLSSIIYLVESVFIMYKPSGQFFTLHTKANDTAIFFFFRQLNFVLLLLVAIYIKHKEIIKQDNRSNKNKSILLSVVLLLLLPVLAHNLSSHNPNYYFYLTDHKINNGKAIWDVRFINLLIVMWLISGYFSFKINRLPSDLWSAIVIICMSAVMCNINLLVLDRFNTYIWYISRSVEVLSVLLVIGLLINNVFRKLIIATNMAMRDPMTQIFNKNYFDERLESILKNILNIDSCVLIVDIDNFKKINDKWGPLAGNRTLLAVVDIINKNIPSHSVFSRIGGEEFGIIINNVNYTDSIDFSKK